MSWNSAVIAFSKPWKNSHSPLPFGVRSGVGGKGVTVEAPMVDGFSFSVRKKCTRVNLGLEH